MVLWGFQRQLMFCRFKLQNLLCALKAAISCPQWSGASKEVDLNGPGLVSVKSTSIQAISALIQQFSRQLGQ